MMTRIDVKMMNSKELRETKNMIEDELTFRASIGKELKSNEISRRNKGIDELHDKNVWLSAEDWSTNHLKLRKEDEAKENSERS